jgi:Ca2+-binding EF-hand superfamily protein
MEMDPSNKEVEGLINCLDDLPLLLGKVKVETNNKSRYQSKYSIQSSCVSLTLSNFIVHGPNYSFQVGLALNGQDPSSRNQYQNRRLAFQTKKVLEKLSTLPESKNVQRRSVQENARAAKEALLKFKKSGINLNSFYKQYDTSKSGNLTYKDFSDILLSMSTGIGREDACFLASNIDRHKSGYIEYDKLIKSLDQVERAASPRAGSNTSGSFSTNNAGAERSNYAYNNNDDVPIVLESPAAVNTKTAREEPVEEKRTMSATPSTTFNRISSNIDDFSTYSMSPRVYTLDPNTKTKIKMDNLSSPTGTGRRFYYENPATAMTSTLKERTQPYYIDPPYAEVKEERKKKRSSSAPPRSSSASNSSRVLANQTESPKNTNNEEKSFSISNDLDLSNSTSLKRALQNTRRRKDDDNSSTASKSNLPLKNPLTKLRENLNERSTSLLQNENKTLENNLMYQIKGKYNNLKFIMSQQDRSKSGKINLQEFKRSLARLGVQLTQQQMEKLFAINLPSSSVNNTSSTANNKSSDENTEENNNNLNRKNIQQHFYYNHQSNNHFFNTSSININDKEKCIDINNFVSGMEERVKSSLFEHISQDISVNGNKLNQFIEKQENLKISKKVANTLNGLTRPEKCFDALYPSNCGYLTVDQLTQSLKAVGTDITPNEVEVITQKLTKGPRGEISLTDFQKNLMNSISTLEKDAEEKKKEIYLKNNSKYNSRTYQSSIVLGDAGQEFETNYSQVRAKDAYTVKTSKEWSHLQKNLQKNYSKILNVFSENGSASQDPTSEKQNRNLQRQKSIANSLQENEVVDVSVDQLQKKLIKEGIILGNDDFVSLQSQIYRKLYSENRLPASNGSSQNNTGNNNNNNAKPKITVDDFCEVVGIPVRRNGKNNRVGKKKIFFYVFVPFFNLDFVYLF